MGGFTDRISRALGTDGSGGGLLGGAGMSPPAIPATPDYVGAAKETAKGNLELEKYRTTANRVNQNSAGGSTSYVQNPDGTWTQNQKLNQPNQATYDTAAGQLSQNATLNADKLATSAGDPSLLNNQVTNALYAQQAQYLDPQFKQQQGDLENKLANQGITRGSEAWNREIQNAALQKQQAYGNAAAQAIGGGTQAAQGMFGMNLQNAQLQNQAGAQNLNQQIAMQNQYGNLMNVAQGGVPTSPISQQGAVAGPDILGAVNGQSNFNMGMYNSQTANQTNARNGILSLAGASMGGGGGK